MTLAQITYALTSKGLNFDEWYTLEDSFQYLTMNSDKNLHYYPRAVQFYFSSNGNYVLLRYTHGKAYTYEGSIPAGAGLVSTINGESYLFKIEPGGIVDSLQNAGVYHEIFSYGSISGMFYK